MESLSELNTREQTTLLNDVEIAGIPEYKNESAVYVVLFIATKLGMQQTEQDVVSAERVGLRCRSTGNKDNAEMR